jgi:hypothetical protein
VGIQLAYVPLLVWLAAGPGADDRPVTGRGRDGTAATITQGVVGRVVAADGHPIANAWIRPASLERPGPPIPEIAIVSEADGRYRWPLPPGQYQVSVSADGYREATRPVTVSPGTTVTLDFVLDPDR